MKPGIDWRLANLSCALFTFVESADCGRNEEFSFFWTSLSLLWNDPPARPTSRKTIASAPITNTDRGLDRRAGASSGGSSSSVIKSSIGYARHVSHGHRHKAIGIPPD